MPDRADLGIVVVGYPPSPIVDVLVVVFFVVALVSPAT